MAVVLSLVFLSIGIIIGFLGQNSRMCFIGGFRDFLLVRDTGLLEGLFAFLGATWFFMVILRLTGIIQTNYPSITRIFFSPFGILSLAGGIAIGFFSTLSGGCPMRHHVMLGQGRIDSAFFFIGFYAGIIVFYTLAVNILKIIF